MGSLLKLLSGRGKKKFNQVDAKFLPHLGILVIFIVAVVARLLYIIVVLRALALARAVVVPVVLGVDPDWLSSGRLLVHAAAAALEDVVPARRTRKPTAKAITLRAWG